MKRHFDSTKSQVAAALACIAAACTSESSTGAPGPDSGLALDSAAPPSSADAAGTEAGPSPDGGTADAAPKPFAVNPRFSGMTPGSLTDLGAYKCEDPKDWKSGYDCSTITDYSGFAYDSKRHRMVMFGGGHAATARTDVRALDLSGPLTWESDYPSMPWGDMTRANADLVKSIWISTGHPMQHHTYDQLVYVPTIDRLVDMAPASGRILYSMGYPSDMPPESTSTDVFEYNADSKAWKSYSTPPRWAAYGATSFDPPSGLVLSLGIEGLWSWDPAAHVAAKVLSLSGQKLSYGQNMVYVPSIDAHLYLRADGIVFRAAFNRNAPAESSLTLLATKGSAPPATKVDEAPDPTETGWALDAKRNRVCGGLISGTFYCLDVATLSWSAHPLPGATPPQRFAFHTIQYDPINDVYIFISLAERHTYAWRPN
jgi:hypothetical protein